MITPSYQLPNLVIEHAQPFHTFREGPLYFSRIRLNTNESVRSKLTRLLYSRRVPPFLVSANSAKILTRYKQPAHDKIPVVSHELFVRSVTLVHTRILGSLPPWRYHWAGKGLPGCLDSYGVVARTDVFSRDNAVGKTFNFPWTRGYRLPV